MPLPSTSPRRGSTPRPSKTATSSGGYSPSAYASQPLPTAQPLKSWLTESLQKGPKVRNAMLILRDASFSFKPHNAIRNEILSKLAQAMRNTVRQTSLEQVVFQDIVFSGGVFRTGWASYQGTPPLEVVPDGDSPVIESTEVIAKEIELLFAEAMQAQVTFRNVRVVLLSDFVSTYEHADLIARGVNKLCEALLKYKVEVTVVVPPEGTYMPYAEQIAACSKKPVLFLNEELNPQELFDLLAFELLTVTGSTGPGNRTKSDPNVRAMIEKLRTDRKAVS